MSEQTHQENDSREDTQRLNDVADFVSTITKLMSANKLRKFDFQEGDFRISLRRESNKAAQPDAAEFRNSTSQAGEDALPEPLDDEPTRIIKAPMIGTFYAAPSPGESPFVTAGDVITEGDVVGIIEAMKIMNEIAADCSGEVVEIIAENGQTVEFGSPLMRVRTVA
ncbi:MAG: acetyl-CoA carboxylase biotin carboxyl carrier protein [Chloroflexota bacterium]